MTQNLFINEPIFLPMQDGEVLYFEDFFNNRKHDLYSTLESTIKWQEGEIKFFGKQIKIPRLEAWYGDLGKEYSYSGQVLIPHPWTPELLFIKRAIEKVSGVVYTSVLMNYYRDGNDSMGWHADDEKELGINPVIGSVSFGAERKFHLKHKTEKGMKMNITLKNGSLLLMKGSTQHYWKHQIPKSKKIIDPRINLTFRVIKN